MTIITGAMAAKSAYAAPKLTVYGAVADLTASGLSGSCETGNVNKNTGACVGNFSGTKPNAKG